MGRNNQPMCPSGLKQKWAARFESRSFKAKVLLGGALIAASFVTFAQAQSSVTLGWNASPDPSVLGYYLYYGSKSAIYTNRLSSGLATSKTVSNLVSGVTYYFVVTAYSGAGLESDPSSELAYTVPLPSPKITTWRKLTSGNFTVSGTSGAGQTCVLLAASNLAAPIVWTPVATNTASTNGVFSCSDLRATNYARRFYRIQAR